MTYAEALKRIGHLEYSLARAFDEIAGLRARLDYEKQSHRELFELYEQIRSQCTAANNKIREENSNA